MKLINFIIWLSAGAFVGWLARWMVDAEHNMNHKPTPVEASNSAQS